MIFFQRGTCTLSFVPNSCRKYKCPCVKYTRNAICLQKCGIHVDRPVFRCYTLAINLRNESIEARFARVCLPATERSFRQTERVRRRSSCIGRVWVLVRRIRSAGLSQILVKRYQWSFGVICFPYFHGPLCRRSIFYPHRRGKGSGINKKR